ncbi:type II toxin-antitoxin system Phd/YefM family antitoxin [Actinomycetospora atypica]|uniref:Antitoxin n=1 Tax=Actinomycetospora atypica TaxID=1290095 RepID=A0ABV9YN90_9PSEU
MTEQVNVYEAKTQLSRLLERVEAGEEIVIARHGRPVARLVPEQRKVGARRLGGLEGKIRVIGDWHEGDEEIADMILGRELDVSPPG